MVGERPANRRGVPRMLRWAGVLLAGFLGAATAAAGTVDPTFDRIVDEVVARYQLPGIAVGVIDGGEIVYEATRGELVAGSGDPVTQRSLFKIASNSKAMTASVLARLVEAGKLRWEDPVVRYLPDFAMHDPWVTRNMQVRDLLVHNSGLPEGGGDLMLWPEPNRFTRADIIHGLRYIKPAYGFRSGYAYDNLLYVVAGEVAAAAGSTSYEELVRREVFQPLALSRCRVGAWTRDDVDDVAQPHMRKNGRNVPINADEAQVPAITSAAAGGIRCSLDDMLAWARNWLVPTPVQLQWLSPAQRRELWTARTPMPISERRRAWDNTHYLAYADGWRLADVDGAWTVSHTGTLSGMYSVMTLLPDRKAGFVVLINGDGDDARTVINEMLLKHFTAPGRRRSVASYADELAKPSPAPHKAGAPIAPHKAGAPIATPAAVSPKDMAPWLGIYRDPWLGEVSICPQRDSVRFQSTKSPLLSGRVARSGPRYFVDWDGDNVDTDAWLDFAASPDGAVALTMAKVDPDADFSSDFEDLAFTRMRSCG
jgi:CubicO group peptidase (beta-lactamase class C family)